MNTRKKVLEVLKTHGPQSTKGVMAILGGTYASVHTLLQRLFLAGKVVDEHGVWKLFSQITPGVPVVAAQQPIVEKVLAATQGVKKLKNRFILLVDNSSSMESIKAETERAVNQTIDTIRAESIRSGQETEVSLYYFDFTAKEPSFFLKAAKDVQRIVYRPYGDTALFDAVNKAIEQHKSLPSAPNEDVSYVLICITDGRDNRSRDYAGRGMNELIRQVQGTDRWTVTFQLPPGQKSWFCHSFSVPHGNVQEWNNDAAGTAEAAFARDMGVNAFYGLRSAGATSSMDFYNVTTDLSKLDPNQLKAQCKDVRSEVKIWEVPRETDIQSFVQSQTGRPYQSGTVFYTLSKSEKVQAGKKVLVMEKGQRGVYAGDAARALVGIKPGENCRVKPGNHSNFDIFVQSTSVNRVLVRGTKLISWPNA